MACKTTCCGKTTPQTDGEFVKNKRIPLIHLPLRESQSRGQLARKSTSGRNVITEVWKYFLLGNKKDRRRDWKEIRSIIIFLLFPPHVILEKRNLQKRGMKELKKFLVRSLPWSSRKWQWRDFLQERVPLSSESQGKVCMYKWVNILAGFVLLFLLRKISKISRRV